MKWELTPIVVKDYIRILEEYKACDKLISVDLSSLSHEQKILYLEHVIKATESVEKINNLETYNECLQNLNAKPSQITKLNAGEITFRLLTARYHRIALPKIANMLINKLKTEEALDDIDFFSTSHIVNLDRTEFNCHFSLMCDRTISIKLPFKLINKSEAKTDWL